MLPLKSIGLLGLTPILQSSACRFAPLLSQQDLRPQCFPKSIHGPFGDPWSSIRSSVSSTVPRSYSTTSPRASTQSSFTYRIGASFSAKGQEFKPRRDHFTHDPNRLRRKYDTGRPNSGQDAFFVGNLGNSTSVAFGVADGVGGWSESGIDSADFSHGLCKYIMKAVNNFETYEEALRPQGLIERIMKGRIPWSDETALEALNADKLLQIGYNRVVADKTIAGGGSTACVAVGRGDGSFRVAK